MPNRSMDKPPENSDDDQERGKRQHVLQHHLTSSRPHDHALIISQNGYLCRQNERRPRTKNATMGRRTAGIAGNQPFFASTIMRIVSP